jgi:hypothetical protein
MTARSRKPTARQAPPTPAEEKAAYIRGLEKRGEAVECDGPLPPGATHRIEVTRTGAKRVKRKRFSAV